MTRRNVGQWVGVFVSAIWIAASFLWDYRVREHEYLRALDYASRACESPTGLATLQCHLTGSLQVRAPSMLRPEYVLFAIIPVACGWVIAYALIGVGHWLLAGRKTSN